MGDTCFVEVSDQWMPFLSKCQLLSLTVDARHRHEALRGKQKTPSLWIHWTNKNAKPQSRLTAGGRKLKKVKTQIRLYSEIKVSCIWWLSSSVRVRVGNMVVTGEMVSKIHGINFGFGLARMWDIFWGKKALKHEWKTHQWKTKEKEKRRRARLMPPTLPWTINCPPTFGSFI